MNWNGWLVLALLALCAPVLAQEAGEPQAESAEQAGERKVYRSVGKDGSVTFSDQGEAGQQEVELRTPNTVDMKVPKIDPVPSSSASKKKDAEAAYQVTITRPSADQTFQNPSDPVAVGFTVAPPLRKGHTAEVVYDGQVLEGKTIERPQRGEHTVQVRVVDESGAELAASESVTFFVHRPSRRLP